MDEAFKSPAACQFRGQRGKAGKFARVAENATLGTEIFRVSVFPRQRFNVQALDGSRSDGYFTFREIDRRTVALILHQSLEDLVDQSAPISALQFRLSCRGRSGPTDYLPVTVYIDDINDNRPEFIGTPYNVSLDESATPGLTVFRGISALDRDKPGTANAAITYSIVSGNSDRKFSLEGRNSVKTVLVLRKALDFDAGERQFILTIRAQDNGNPPMSSETELIINVNDSDDLGPKFTERKYKTTIQEDFPIKGHQIQRLLQFSPPLHASDQDIGMKSPLHYSILKGNQDDYFSIDPATGLLYQTKEIDADVLPENVLKLEIEAKQTDNPLKSDIAIVEITIEDINDNAPKFAIEEYNMTIVENLPDGFEIMSFQATDADKGSNAQFIYTLKDPSESFEIGTTTGTLSLKNPRILDFEAREFIELEVGTRELVPNVAPVGRNASKSESVKIKINIEDENDNPPTFHPSSLFTFSIPSTIGPNERVGDINVSDNDSGLNGQVKILLLNHTDLFQINQDTGRIRTLASGPALSQNKYMLTIKATDQAENAAKRFSTLGKVHIYIEAPKVPRSLPIEEGDDQKGGEEIPIHFPLGLQEFEVKRNGKKGTTIGKVDILNPNNVELHWVMRHRYRNGVPFGIDRRNGKIGLVKDIGSNALDTYFLKVSAETPEKDRFITEIKLSITEPEEKIITKIPFIPPMYNFTVKENLPGALIANLTELTALVKRNSTGNPSHKDFTISNDDQDVKNKFSVTDSGLLYTKDALDREDTAVFELSIDLGRGILRSKDQFKIHIEVEDDNDNSPAFDRHIYQGSIEKSAAPGTPVNLGNVVKVTDPDLNDRIQLQLLGKGSNIFRLDPLSGNVFLSSQEVLANMLKTERLEKLYLRIRASDSLDHITESQLVVHLLDTKADQPPEVRGLAIINSRFVELKEKDHLLVNEDTPPGTQLARVMATDESSSVKDFRLEFVILEEIVSDIGTSKIANASSEHLNIAHFEIAKDSGDIVLKRKLSPTLEYSLNITVRDENEMETLTIVIISVKDINDHKPRFSNQNYAFEIIEGDYVDKKIGEVISKDDDIGINGKLTYELKSASVLPFWIDKQNGSLYANGSLHHQANDSYLFEVVATDGSLAEPMAAKVNVTVKVLEVNDHEPEFIGFETMKLVSVAKLAELGLNVTKSKHMPYYESPIANDLQRGDLLTKINASDKDGQEVQFRLVNNHGFLKISDSGSLLVEKDTFVETDVEIFVQIKDKADLPKSSIALLVLKIQSPSTPSTTSTSKPSSTMRMEIAPSTTQELVTTMIPVTLEDVSEVKDYEEAPRRQEPRKISLSQPFIQESRLFASSSETVEVYENLKTPHPILDLNDYLTEDLSTVQLALQGSDSGQFILDQATGQVFIANPPDRELKDHYNFTIQAYIPAPNSGDKKVPVLFYTLYINDHKNKENLVEDELNVVVTILDVNDNRPEFLTNADPMIISLDADIDSGSMLAKIEAWDADLGLNAEIRYSLVGSNEFFRIQPETGDLELAASVLREAGKSFEMKVEAKDSRGERIGLYSSIGLIVHVLNPSYQVHLILENKVQDVLLDMPNITQTLTSLSGFEVLSHSVTLHEEDSLLIQPELEKTDLFVYATDSNHLVNTDRIVRSLTNQLSTTRQQLSNHGLLELRAGSFVLSPDAKSPFNQINQSHGHHHRQGALGTWEVTLLIMACAIFLGGLIALVTVCSIRYKRGIKAYPAPLAIPLPFNTMDAPPPPPQIIAHGPPSMGAVVPGPSILHHGEPRRQSVKSNSYRSHHTHMESSEDTSDTCLDDHMDMRSPDHHQSHNFLLGFRSRSNSHKNSSSTPKESKKWHKRSRSWKESLSKEDSSKDSGISRGGALEDESEDCCDCRNSIASSCDSCSECLLDSRHNTYSHFSRSPSHLSHRRQTRRHKSASPSRKSWTSNGPNSQDLTGTPKIRSRSVGNGLKDDCVDCQRRSHQQSPCHCCSHCGDANYWDRSRNEPLSKSTRSTKWEVYHDWGRDSAEASLERNLERRKRATFDPNLESSTRAAASSTNKAHSWRGDHPMKHGHYFHHEHKHHHAHNPHPHEGRHQHPSASQQPISMPFRTTYSYGEDVGGPSMKGGSALSITSSSPIKSHSSSSPVANGIKLVGLAQSSPRIMDKPLQSANL
ncbi:hypothetical protein TCAL_09282 [Tigriopus californicus]|uniref:Cadherin domain-containing protein n=1 Tax=Tigriopus californicus TaxID=6832 RepID=A0A553PU07_TIGCA|nr:hypothetical protein TCAL_09282 [Tigriopus californicus]